MTDTMIASRSQANLRSPRVGFLGVGWIGRHRLQALIEAGVVEAVGVADPSPEMLDAALELAPGASAVDGLHGLLDLDLDGLVIATPSALHARQSIAALERGVAVFCQKPLGRDRAEVAAVVETARRADRLLAVDLSYRHVEAMRRVRDIVAAGEIGRVFHVDLTFHNAYGPDKAWFYDPALAGGGCVMDLGTHLVDLALWTLDGPEIASVSSALLSGGRPLGADMVEDFGVATLTLSSGAVVRLACSWRLPAGQDAVISAAFYGTEGGVAFSNVGGSFYDFAAERLRGQTRERLVSPPDAWGGRAAVAWARGLAGGGRFDPEADKLVRLAETLDRIYAGR
ncbi:Gfo/Idh/MocA family oxidoreductase [uncultured Caulobacter sp.]|uniref:Gfo/Idh/MocA family protein n=1 Tax=uncultured Caulobacter sp. TaxID=158749 RepID=UPI002621BAEB|nr:Gfo/Idh/MocA family oxidoreductase [uncultured Caulobacter sp.]